MMIEKLIREMITGCYLCNGSGMELDSEGQFTADSEDLCVSCNGTGKVVSYKGEQLRHLILRGELP